MIRPKDEWKRESGRRLGRLAGLLFLINFAFCMAALAQPGAPNDAPPPLKTFSKEERKQLAAKMNLKARTKLALELMENRLAGAERLAAAGDHAVMYTELGGFHAIMDHVIGHLDKLDETRGKVLDGYKRFELGLRGFTPRLETLRREVPLEYEHYIHSLLKYLRDTRARALEPMFSDTIVPGNDPKSKKEP